MTHAPDTTPHPHPHPQPQPRNSERAQATAEFALVAPAMFAVLWMVFAFGHAYGKLLDLQSATREGARRASIAYKDVHAVTAATGHLRNTLALNDPDNVTISVTPAPAPEWQHGQEITVETSTPVQVRVIGFPLWSGTLRAKAETRVE